MMSDCNGAAAPRLHRLRRAAELRLGAELALQTAAHHRLQAFITRALAEIDEANYLLERTNVSAKPALLTLIDMELAVAEYRLRAATLALRIHGANVADIG